MNRRLIITIAIAIALLIAAASITMYFLSFRNITFNFKKTDLVASIYRSDDTDKKNKLAEVKNTQTIRLQEGNYAAIAGGDNYDRAAFYFSVNKNDSTVTIDPPYSDTYLKNALTAELPAIKAALTKAFPSVAASFDTADGKLYKEGEWYATALTQHPADPRDEGDTYYTIMKKDNGTWTVIGKPSLVLTTVDFKDVPTDIVKDANHIGE
jgi:flagellar basal body-associated protein FliL